MHDLVRDMALHITRGTPRFLVKAGMSLTEPLDVQEWKQDLEQVSFMKNRELQVMYPLKKPPPRCPMITTLLVSDCGIKSIPGAFFKHMHGLKILDLSENPIKSLPGSISDLKNLTALLLAYCQNLKKVPSLSKLGVLKMLNGIPNGILSKLSCLQHLNVGETSVRGEEIAGFKKLEFFEGRFNDVSNLNMYVHALHDREGPREYLIVKCNLVCSEDDLLFSRFFRIPLATFSTLRILNINNCENMKRLFSPNCVPLNLQQLSVTDCNQMEEIIASEPESEGGGLVSLEHRLPQLTQLLLMDLPELKSICSVNEVMICDSLEKFWVLNCPKLKRMPLNPPELDNVRSSAAPALRIYIKPKEWWESVEWHHPDSKSLLEPFLRFW
ncbi:putative disease resistance protein At1g63350 [Hibiscus syriacus]|nr:putative disease resistance protein At1g63350 [Hibiscus syriacus]